MEENGKEELKAGYLIMRLKPGEGVMVMECIEVRLISVGTSRYLEAQIAVKAPKDILIRRLR